MGFTTKKSLGKKRPLQDMLRKVKGDNKQITPPSQLSLISSTKHPWLPSWNTMVLSLVIFSFMIPWKTNYNCSIFSSTPWPCFFCSFQILPISLLLSLKKTNNLKTWQRTYYSWDAILLATEDASHCKAESSLWLQACKLWQGVPSSWYIRCLPQKQGRPYLASTKVIL